MSKEEKAREVLKLHFGSSYVNTFIEPEDEQCTVNAMIEFSESETAQLREALREIIKEWEEWTFPTAEKQNNSGYYDYYVEVDDLKSLINKAKALIE